MYTYSTFLLASNLYMNSRGLPFFKKVIKTVRSQPFEKYSFLYQWFTALGVCILSILISLYKTTEMGWVKETKGCINKPKPSKSSSNQALVVETILGTYRKITNKRWDNLIAISWNLTVFLVLLLSPKRLLKNWDNFVLRQSQRCFIDWTEIKLSFPLLSS